MPLFYRNISQITIKAGTSANYTHASVQQLFAAATSMPMQHPTQSPPRSVQHRPQQPAMSYQPPTMQPPAPVVYNKSGLQLHQLNGLAGPTTTAASSNCSSACSSGYQSDLSPRNPLGAHHHKTHAAATATAGSGAGGNSL